MPRLLDDEPRPLEPVRADFRARLCPLAVLVPRDFLTPLVFLEPRARVLPAFLVPFVRVAMLPSPMSVARECGRWKTQWREGR